MNSLVKRTISGVVFVAVMVGALLLNVYVLSAFALFAMCVMLYEYYNITLKGKQFIVPRILAIISGALMFALMFMRCMYGISWEVVSIILIAVIGVMCYTLFTVKKEDFPQSSVLYSGLLYIAVPVSLLNHIAIAEDGSFRGLLILCFFIIIWASDTGAYCVGCTLGKNSKKMCPSISPKKSWWGFVGGMFFATLAGVVMSLVGMLQVPVWHAAILGAIMHCFGVCGDLYESQWKRSFGVKDSGNIIPGHGGFMDRFDSSLFAIPAAAVYLNLFNLL